MSARAPLDPDLVELVKALAREAARRHHRAPANKADPHAHADLRPLQH
jgi:hypothetical protein